MTKKLSLRQVYSRGFTIVELLIVIVVIGILVAIAIVGYSGIQNRAHAARAASIIDSYSKILEMYKIDHGYYPLTDQGVGTEVCLGTADNYPATGALGEGACAPGNLSPDPIAIDSTLTSMLSPYANTLPPSDLPAVGDDMISFRGVIYSVSPLNDNVALIYHLHGDQDCARGTAILIEGAGNSPPITQCRTILTN